MWPQLFSYLYLHNLALWLCNFQSMNRIYFSTAESGQALWLALANRTWWKWLCIPLIPGLKRPCTLLLTLSRSLPPSSEQAQSSLLKDKRPARARPSQRAFFSQCPSYVIGPSHDHKSCCSDDGRYIRVQPRLELLSWVQPKFPTHRMLNWINSCFSYEALEWFLISNN